MLNSCNKNPLRHFHLFSSSVLLSRSRSFEACLERPIFIKFRTARKLTRLSDTVAPVDSCDCDFFMKNSQKYEKIN